MIPRTLVPPDARPAKLIATPGRPSALDERTLIPGYMSTGPLEEETKIPAGLPLDSITERVVVPRDAKIFPYTAPPVGDVTAQPSTLDDRVVIPAGTAAPPENSFEFFTRPEDLVEGDVFTTGELQLLVTPVNRAQRTREELINRVTTSVIYGLILLALLFRQVIFASTRRRRRMTKSHARTSRCSCRLGRSIFPHPRVRRSPAFTLIQTS